MNKETDRELLELAAKAIGKDVNCVSNEGIHCYDTEIIWNPLTDDGDNARLESKLEFDVQWFKGGVLVGPPVCGKENGKAYFEYFDKHSSKQSARRLAGVKAAAEIGRNIK